MGELENVLQDVEIAKSIMLAKRLLIDNIYSQANLEGIAVTFADTNDILNNVNVNSLNPNDISRICCLRDGWNFLLDTLLEDLSLTFIEELHSIVARFDVYYTYLGKPRADNVVISGTSWRPSIPNVEKVYETLKTYNGKKGIDSCIDAGLYLMRTQFFKDGNKRIGSFVINKLLIRNGIGIFKVPVELDSEFKKRLVQFYEFNDSSELLEFVKDNCIVYTE